MGKNQEKIISRFWGAIFFRGLSFYGTDCTEIRHDHLRQIHLKLEEGADDGPHLGVGASLLLRKQSVNAGNGSLILAHLSHDKIDLGKGLRGGSKGTIDKYVLGLSQNPSAMIAHEEHQQFLLLIIHEVVVPQENIARGGDCELVRQILLDFFSILRDGRAVAQNLTLLSMDRL